MDFDIPVPITNDLEKRIAETFNLFDHIGNKTIDVREVGTILRFLGCAPTEQEINEIIWTTEFEDLRGIIHLSRFLPHICQLLTERKMEPASPEKLLEAFQVLDPVGLGYVTKEFLSKMMTEEGEPFTQEELDEMLAVAVDPQTGVIAYEFYMNQLMVMNVLFILKSYAQIVISTIKYEPKKSIYDLADKIEAERKANLPPPKTTMADILKTL